MASRSEFEWRGFGRPLARRWRFDDGAVFEGEAAALCMNWILLVFGRIGRATDLHLHEPRGHWFVCHFGFW